MNKKEILENFNQMSDEDLKLLHISFLQLMSADYLLIKEVIDKSIFQITDGEKTPVQIYRKLRSAKKYIEEQLKGMEQSVVDEIEENPSEYPDFTISTRKTFNFKQNPEYLQDYEKLKEREKILKLATEMNLKGDTYVDADGIIIEPVEVKLNQVLTYKAKR